MTFDLRAQEYMLNDGPEARYVPPLGCDGCPFLKGANEFTICDLLGGVYIDNLREPQCRWDQWSFKARGELKTVIQVALNVEP